MKRLFATALLLGTGVLRAEPANIASRLERIRATHGVPALAAAAVDRGAVVAVGAVGLRRVGGHVAVTIDDRWHLGSCTKSMTSAVAAMLVDEGSLQWDTTIGKILPEVTMHPIWREVTLEQLLTHRSGAPHRVPDALWGEACARVGLPIEQRFALVKGILAQEPERVPGSDFLYSDAGYSLAAAMLERVSGDSWEDLVQQRLFAPLALRSAGFGEPVSRWKMDQPFGHLGDVPPFKPVPPGPDADNPPAIAPAATVHMSISDFARYAAWHVAGARGEATLLTPQAFRKIHTPPAGQKYAMGWAITPRRWAGGPALMHNGDNTMFYAVMWLGPDDNTCFVAATNADGYAAEAACEDAITMLINSF